jgi:hypothetical protein
VGVYGLQMGAGWRADCWGSWNGWMESVYPALIDNEETGFPSRAWQLGPIVLSPCEDMSTWLSKGE